MDWRRSVTRIKFYRFCHSCADETLHRRVNGSLHQCTRCQLDTYIPREEVRPSGHQVPEVW